MHDLDRIAIDRRVCRGLGKLPGERIVDAARRVLAARDSTLPQRRAAAILMSDDKRPIWTRMWHAAEVLGDER
jgi:hypothetical protein